MAAPIIHLVGLVSFFVVAFLGAVYVEADNSTNYEMLPESDVNGPEAARCIGQGPCFGKKLTCPRKCKKRSIIAPGRSACFIDCAKCETTCKHRKVNCYGFGAVCYDPRFIGGDGVIFFFHGEKDHDFCIVSDKSIHINAHFIGKRPEGRTRDVTWVQGLGMLFDSHKLGVAAKKVGIWSDSLDQFKISYDGEEVLIPESEGAVWISPSGQVLIERTADVNSVHLVIDQLMDVSINVVPITQKDSKLHDYQITSENCYAHLQMQFNFFGFSDLVDGVLGQTYQAGFKNPVKLGVRMPVMGGEENYLSSSLFSADCKVNQFSAAPLSAENPIQPFSVECTHNDGGLACRR